MFELKTVKMLSDLLVFTISLILISTDIKRYEEKKKQNQKTGTVIQKTMVSQAYFTKTWYWTLLAVGEFSL